MLVYKALYRKMMDDLKDAGMWIDWADQLHDSHPEVAKYLCDSARERLEKTFPKTHEYFKNICASEKGEGHSCLNEMVEEHLMEWYEGMMNRIRRHG